MKYLHDVYVNWVDGGSRSHEIPEYFEWKDGDPVEMFDEIMLVRVTPKFFNILNDGYEVIPNELLKMVYNTAKRINPNTKRRNQVAYAFVASDGEHAIVINTEGDDKPNLKSRLVIRHETLALEMVNDIGKIYDFDGELSDCEEDNSLEAMILSSSPKDYIGLTRIEKEMKQIVFDCLYNLSLSKNIAEVKYWYIELFPEMIGDEILEKVQAESMILDMFDYLRQGWSKRHEEWGTLAVKYEPNDIYTDEWKDLVKESKGKDKVKK